MEDERDAEDAIRGLDQIDFGRQGRRLRVEWTKQERSNSQRPESARKPLSNARPSKTLFVINFDPYHTRTRDLERHFDRYGKIQNVRIRRNFAFIQFEVQEDATKALEATNLSKLMDRVISVEYANKDDDERRNGGSPHSDRRSRDRSPARRREYGGGGGGRRSPSPAYRRREERASPDYGRGRSPSPYKGRGGRRASPDYGHDRRRSSPDHGHGYSKERNDNNDYHNRSPPPPRRRSPSPKDMEEEEGAVIAGEMSRSISPKRQTSSGDEGHHNNHTSPSPEEDSRVEMKTISPPTNYGADSPDGGVAYSRSQ
ncbi:serine/arginine-rich splicing factor RS41 isoform X2 [Impatiens glandulifera]|nr:serine/arginine-rich splicing factor RS41 isoform X2 [Impatiens glandulifera]